MKHVFITGISSGIGRELVRAFQGAGWMVHGSVRNPEDADAVRRAFPNNVFPTIMDVTDESAIQAAAKETAARCDGALALLINNAGIAVSGPAALIPTEAWRRQFEVNLFGVMTVTRAFLPLLQQGNGRIFNISSVSGRLAYPFLAPYVASKHALEGASQSLRRECLALGVDVVLIAPGSVKTPIWEKESATTIPSEYDLPPWDTLLRRIQKMMLRNAESGLNADKLARHILCIAHKKRPRSRYTFVRHAWRNWRIPYYFLSDRMLDRLLKKMLFDK
ncbi:MAG: SDR family oxidoreductase [Calditrichaeota bacterium]|nr:MAG: SDR family oxidoreductase [Calditrichota bacterium]